MGRRKKGDVGFCVGVGVNVEGALSNRRNKTWGWANEVRARSVLGGLVWALGTVIDNHWRQCRSGRECARDVAPGSRAGWASDWQATRPRCYSAYASETSMSAASRVPTYVASAPEVLL